MADRAPLLLDVTRLVWRRWAGVRPTGIDRICFAWLDRYQSDAQATLVHARGRHILSVAASRALFALLLKETPDEPLAAVRRRLPGLALRHAAGLFGRSGGGRPWLNVGHTGLDRPGLAAWCREADVRPVYMVHDLIPITHPQFCRAGEAERHTRRMATMLASGAGLIANSHDTLAEMARFAASAGRALPPALVAWPGTQRLVLPPAADGAGSNRLVVLGTIEGRKNHLLLLRAWDLLIARLGAAAPQLLIIGRRGWACDEALARLDSGRYRGHVIETGAMDDADLGAMLADAAALLFPSLAEGYGLPLVEALAAGVPVLATDLPVFREIGQAVPDLLPADDVAAWAAAIADYATPGSPARAAQQRRLAGFRAPDWASHFAAVDAFLDTLVAAPRRA